MTLGGRRALGAALAVAILLALWFAIRGLRTPTYARDVAPVIHRHCSECHRPGQPAPFPLLTYEDVAKRARQIAEVTQSRIMPPWMPEPGHGDFAGVRGLSPREVDVLRRWAEAGAPEGDPVGIPAPAFADAEWRLGTPDLVVKMPRPYSLRADGPDLYRNFVVPLPLTVMHRVRAFELDPGNGSIVHHAFLMLDRTRQSARRERKDPQPGFDGIHSPSSAESPEGYFLSWQPGKVPAFLPDGHSWPLHPKTDLVLQLHLQPSGKVETIRSRVAFYFTDQAPRHRPVKIWLSSYDIDIPAGESDHALERDYTLPGDVDVLGILPHAHYLAREMRVHALLPDGSEERLLGIPRWDFNWQGDYRYSDPVFLPRGSRIVMRFVYDNSDGNPSNPHHPPRRVRYGLQSSDEMGELWLQVLPRTDSDRTALMEDFGRKVVEDTFAYNRYLLRKNPDDARALSGLGKAWYFSGKPAQASASFQRAIRIDASLDEPYYYLGLMHRRNGNLSEARKAFTEAARLNPENTRARGNLGLIALEQGELSVAEAEFRKVLERDAEDVLARDSLGAVLFRQKRYSEAVAQFREALRLAPNDPTIRRHLEEAQGALKEK